MTVAVLCIGGGDVFAETVDEETLTCIKACKKKDKNKRKGSPFKVNSCIKSCKEQAK